MDGNLVAKVCLYACITFGFIVNWVTAPAISTTLAEYTWPLGQGIGAAEINTNGTTGTLSNVQYMPGPPDVGSYNTTRFTGAPDSFAIIKVPHYNFIDNAFQFYAYFDDVTNGTILEYLGTILKFQNDSTINNVAQISNFRLYIIKGILNMDIDGFGTHTFSNVYFPNTWYHIMLKRDMSKDHFGIIREKSNNEDVANTSLPIQHIPVSLPGRFRLGSDFLQTDPFRGALACIQWVASASYAEDTSCYMENWPRTTGTSRTYLTSTTPPPPITTPTPPQTTITTSLPPHTTPTPPQTPPPPLTTTTHISTVITVRSRSEATSGPESPVTTFEVRESCVGFKGIADTNFALASDVVETHHVQKMLQCLNICVADVNCLAFITKGNLHGDVVCHISYSGSAQTTYDTGSMLYIIR